MAVSGKPACGARHKSARRCLLDDPATTLEHARLIRTKPLLRRFYGESYQFFLEAARDAPLGPRVEIGSGGGFFRELAPTLITSDIAMLPDVDLVMAAEALPFGDQTLGALFLLNVLHHIPDVRCFFSEASRCLAPGGILAMVEPANTLFSRFVYQRFHHEPFLPDSDEWQFDRGGRLTAANGAMPWIVFCRDRQEFECRFPKLEVRQVTCCSPLMYLLSGGFTLPSLLPGCCAPAVALVEALLGPANAALGLFMRVAVVKR